MVCFAFTHFTLDDRLSMCVYLLFLLRCHQKGWKEVKRKHPYRDERNQEKIYHEPNLSPNFWKPKSGWERGAGGALRRNCGFSVVQVALLPKGLDPIAPGRGLVSKMMCAEADGRDTGRLKQEN